MTASSRSVAVVIPTHNRLESLNKSISSLASQTVAPDEVIVVDDGSLKPVPDSTVAALSERTSARLVRSEKPQGANSARNRGVLESTSEFIAFLDDDDCFVPEKIDVVKKYLAKEPSVDVVYHPANIAMVNEGVTYQSHPRHYQSDFYKKLLVTNFMGGMSMAIVRRSALIDVGLFDEQLKSMQDYEMWLRLARAGKTFALLDQPLTNYTHTTNSGAISNSTNYFVESFAYIQEKYKDDYSKFNQAEKRSLNKRYFSTLVRKSLLNYDTRSAIKFQAKCFWAAPSVTELLKIFVVMLGPRISFYLRSKLS